MDTILEMISRGVEQLLGRASGPLQFRLIVMPTVVTLLAIRAGLRDARAGQPAFLWGLISKSKSPARAYSRGLEGRPRIFIVALVLDTVYQLIVLRAFYVVQALIVAVVCAIVPYVLFRGPTAPSGTPPHWETGRAHNQPAGHPDSREYRRENPLTHLGDRA